MPSFSFDPMEPPKEGWERLSYEEKRSCRELSSSQRKCSTLFQIWNSEENRAAVCDLFNHHSEDSSGATAAVETDRVSSRRVKAFDESRTMKGVEATLKKTHDRVDISPSAIRGAIASVKTILWLNFGRPARNSITFPDMLGWLDDIDTLEFLRRAAPDRVI
jgi:hypothetical protein